MGNPTLIEISREILVNIAMGVAPVRRWRARLPRTNVWANTQKPRSQFDLLSTGWAGEKLTGKSVAEIGPGDAIPLGLFVLGAGADRYVAIDRFPADVFGKHAGKLYEALLDESPDLANALRQRGLAGILGRSYRVGSTGALPA